MDNIAPSPVHAMAFDDADCDHLIALLAGRPVTPEQSARTVTLIGYITLCRQTPLEVPAALPGKTKTKAKAARKPRAAKAAVAQEGGQQAAGALG